MFVVAFRSINTDVVPEAPINIGGEAEFTALKLAKRVINHTGANAKIIFLPLPSDDPTRRRPDTSAA